MTVKHLMTELVKRHNLESFAKLAPMLDMHTSNLYKVYYGSPHSPSAAFILKVYDATDMTIEEIREYLMEGKESCRPNNKSSLDLCTKKPKVSLCEKTTKQE